MGGARGGADRAGERGRRAARGDPGLVAAQHRRAKGSHDDADRQRVPQCERRAAASPWPLRQSAARQVAVRGAERLSRHRPGGGAREPGGDVHRNRVRYRHPRGGRGDRGDQRPLQAPDRTNGAVLIQVINPEKSRCIVEYAFEYARANGRTQVTAVHKANIMKFSDGLFLREAQAVAERYRDIAFNDRIVDNMCMQLMQKTQEYDVLVMPNLYGDIVSDLVAGMVGGLGVAPSGNIGPDSAVFEAIHGSAPSHAGKNEANPTAMILSGALMLRHLGERAAAERVEGAVADVIAAGKDVTYDLRQDRDPSKAATTTDMTDAIIGALAA